LSAVQERIQAGDPFEAGPFKMDSSGRRSKVTGREEELDPRTSEPNEPSEPVDSEENSESDSGIYLVHTFRRVKDPQFPWRVRIFLEGASEDNLELERVDRVAYRHSSLDPPNPETKDKDTNFELRLSVWGQFNISADVYLKGKPEPLRLQRYLNF
jgi:hypothetical protein